MYLDDAQAAALIAQCAALSAPGSVLLAGWNSAVTLSRAQNSSNELARQWKSGYPADIQAVRSVVDRYYMTTLYHVVYSITHILSVNHHRSTLTSLAGGRRTREVRRSWQHSFRRRCRGCSFTCGRALEVPEKTRRRPRPTSWQHFDDDTCYRKKTKTHPKRITHNQLSCRRKLLANSLRANASRCAAPPAGTCIIQDELSLK